MTTPRMWFHGLVAAFVGGAAGMLSGSFALMIMNPDQFNLGPALLHTFKTVLILGVVSGLQTAFTYLKQSPLWDGVTERRTVTDVHTETVSKDNPSV